MKSPARKRNLTILVLSAISLMVIFIFSPEVPTKNSSEKQVLTPISSSSKSKTGRIERDRFYHRLLKDPQTGNIPKNIRTKELLHVKSLNRTIKGSGLNTLQDEAIIWDELGPNDVGGRTRALALDLSDNTGQTMIAGGVSGGIWKTTDGGTTWQLKSDPSQHTSVTTIAQDPTNTSRWYYASGEFRGNTASDRGNTATFFGTGLFTSIDNGETWSRLSATTDLDAGWNSEYDFVSKIAIDPNNGDLYVASNGFGVLKSTDNGSSFSSVLGSVGDHRYVDIDIASNGNILAVLSSDDAGDPTPDNVPGVYLSTDQGATWTDITPGVFPSNHERTVTSFAPSNPDIFYTLTFTGTGSGLNEEVKLIKTDISNLPTVNAVDRSSNIPDFGSPVGGMDTQLNYNMLVKVHPTDENFVLIGGTNLFRSTDGFATAPADNSTAEKEKFWIGGYDIVNDVSQFPNHHPDQHSFVFDPNTPDRVISGHDGGLSMTDDIRANPISWTDVNNGYNVTQFYTVDLKNTAGDDRVVGGTQDNGTPFFTFDASTSSASSSEDVSSGDGAYNYLAEEFGYVSSQNGRVFRLKYQSDGSLTSFFESPSGEWSEITPTGASNQLFINPFTVDPNNEDIMYYLAGNVIWRNDSLSSIENGETGTSVGWTELVDLSVSNILTTLTITESNPTHRLYYAEFGSGIVPKIYKLDNANTAKDGETDISIGSAPSGAYIHDLEVNPQNGDEVIAVMSNYNITGLYHTTDGGSNWTAIEGNLESDGTNPGPSLRNAEILPVNGVTHYMVGASTGLFYSTTLNGSSTQWEHVAGDKIGNVPVEFIDSRSDGLIAAATHGRGIFMGKAGREVAVGENGGNAGWRMLSAPVTGFEPSDLEGAPVQGLANGPDESSEPNMFVYDLQTTPDFRAPGFNETLPGATGFILFFFDNSINNSTPLPNNLQAPGVEPDANVSNNLNDNGFTLVGNPFAANLDLSNGITADAQVQNTLHIWDPDNNTYVNSFSIGDSKVLAEWQGFFIETTGSNQSVTFETAGKTSSTPDAEIFAAPDSPFLVSRENNRAINFELEGPENNFDKSIQICFDEKSIKGWDRNDAGKLKPLSTNYTTLSIHGTSNQEGKLLSKDCRSFAIDKPQEFMMQHDAVNLSGKFTLRWPELANIPDDWALELEYLKNGEVIDLHKSRVFEFTSNATKATSQSGKLQKGPVTIPGGNGIETMQLANEATFRLTVTPSVLVDVDDSNGADIPNQFQLAQNFPNPFNPSTQIQFDLPQQADVTLTVYDVTGREVATLVNQPMAAGKHQVTFSAEGLSSGVYIYRLDTAELSITKKMTVIK